MIVLALVLLILVAVLSVAIVLSNPDVYQLSLFRALVPVTSAGVFFTGFGAALVTIIALLLLRAGIRRSRETRRRLRAAELSTSSGGVGSSASQATTERSAQPDAARRGGADRDRTSNGGDESDRTRGGSSVRPDESSTGQAEEPEEPPTDEASHTATPAPGPDPGEDLTTVPVKRRAADRDVDRDEPRT